MQTAQMILKMTDFYNGNQSDINHFLKVHAYAATIGRLEQLDTQTLETLEVAAIVHDIACPLCREKYGNTNGKHQEDESEPLLRDFLEEFSLPPQMLERVIFLVTHHHTYHLVDGIDYQTLLEADFLVNAGESATYAKQIPQFRTRVFQTQTGLHFLDSVYGE